MITLLFFFSLLKADDTFSDIKNKVSKPKKPYIGFIEVFGAEKPTAEEFKSQIPAALMLCIYNPMSDIEVCKAEESKFFDAFKKKYGFEYASWAFMKSLNPKEPYTNIFLDIVKKEDKATRMPFTAEPTRHFSDPHNLIADWKEYEKAGFQLVNSGQLKIDAYDPNSASCPALQCPFGHAVEPLKRYKEIFKKKVNQSLPALFQIAREDAVPENRSAAVQLLAYTNEPKPYVELLVEKTKDPNEIVRNYALRILGDIYETKPSLTFPYKPIVEALNYPKISDRTKAAYIIALWADKSEDVKKYVKEKYLETLLLIFTSQQPEPVEFAHQILKKVSGKDFGRNDVMAWKKYIHDNSVTQKSAK
jgi:hypothetical protein